MEAEQKIQEEEYSYPYHYIPKLEEGNFSQTQHWSWGYRYLGGIKIVLDQIKNLKFNSLVDLGCGDGRFLREVKKLYPERKLLGLDYSRKAVALANAMNPQITFKAVNIIDEQVKKKYDLATAIEVLEHIPEKELPNFLDATSSLLTENGYFILTVPHTNKPLQEKHYQHFTSAKLKELLDKNFKDVTFFPFDSRSKIINYLAKLFGGKGKHFLVTNQKINNLFYKLYIDHFLYSDDESNCFRIAVVCKKKIT